MPGEPGPEHIRLWSQTLDGAVLHGSERAAIPLMRYRFKYRLTALPPTTIVAQEERRSTLKNGNKFRAPMRLGIEDCWPQKALEVEEAILAV